MAYQASIAEVIIVAENYCIFNAEEKCKIYEFLTIKSRDVSLKRRRD
jgi:hypothetical protein